MATSSLLTECIECAANVSVRAARCPACGMNPKGTPCGICDRCMPNREQVKVDVPQEMGRGEGGETFRRHHEMTVHGRCWDALVSELFPASSVAASCSACGTPRPTSKPTDIDFPCRWTCLNCGHPCSLPMRQYGWCAQYGLAIIPERHGYWSVQDEAPFDGIRWLCHERCRRRREDRQWRFTLHRVGDDDRPWWRRILS